MLPLFKNVHLNELNMKKGRAQYFSERGHQSSNPELVEVKNSLAQFHLCTIQASFTRE
jgi:hypothetical protein